MNGQRRTKALAAAGWAALSALVFSGGAGPLFAGARDEIALALKDKVIKDLSSTGLTLSFQIAVVNPAPAPRELVRYRYRVRIDQKDYIDTEITLSRPLAVPENGEMLIGLPVKITYALLRQAVGPVEGRALCDIAGDMFFLNERGKEQKVSFAYSGEFPIFTDPEVELLPLEVLDLTVGGADVVFHPRFKNPNAYDLAVEAIDYELYFGGRLVLSGGIPGDKSLPREGEKAFALPFLVDFFEAGDELRAAFAKDELPCRFSGMIKIASAWGPLVVRFDTTQPLKLAKKS